MSAELLIRVQMKIARDKIFVPNKFVAFIFILFNITSYNKVQ